MPAIGVGAKSERGLASSSGDPAIDASKGGAVVGVLPNALALFLEDFLAGDDDINVAIGPVDSDAAGSLKDGDLRWGSPRK